MFRHKTCRNIKKRLQTMHDNNNIKFMQFALEEAQKAYRIGEVPVGAVIAKNDQVIAAAYNLREQSNDPTAHAEILALRQAAQKLGGWRLSGAKLYVSIEPCPMCAGAMVLARISALIYGADDPKWGAAGSIFNIVQNNKLNHRIEVISGVLAGSSRKLIKNFFAEKRG